MESPHIQVSEGCTGPNVKLVKEGIKSNPGYFGITSQNVFFHPTAIISKINALEELRKLNYFAR